MIPYAIGLDIGIKSVGWAVVGLDSEEQPCGILDMGARIFDEAEHPKTGASLAAPRREARSTRRRLRRHRHRNERIRALLLYSGLLTPAEMDTLFDGELEDIYALRVRALDQSVSHTAFARILIHISQRRGFRSNRKNPDRGGEDGKILQAVNENKRRMEEHGYRTVAELLLRDPEFTEHKRNKGGEYLTTVTRDMVADEVRRIFDSQRRFGAAFADETLETAYMDILLSQRSFDEGPGPGSPYGGDQIAKMIGHCTLIPELPRAAKSTYAFEYFTLLQNINHIRLLQNGASRPLSNEERQALIDLAHQSAELNFAKLRKALALPDDTRFNLVRYYIADSPAEAEKKTKFTNMTAFHKMRTAIDRHKKGTFARYTAEQRDHIGTALTLYRTSARIGVYLSDHGFSEEEIAVIETIGSFSKCGHLSAEACYRLIPHLENGMTYNEACKAAGWDHRAHSNSTASRLLRITSEDLDAITSPVVRRAVSQTVKVINAIVRDYDESPVYINIELAREMSKDFNERKKIDKDIDKNRTENERIMTYLREELGMLSPTGQDLLKYKLYTEQGGVCAYSLKPFAVERLFEAGYAEIDHIVPYSVCFDDTFANKALVFAKENREKGKRLPLEYLTGEKRERFTVWAKSQVTRRAKRERLLKEHITDADRDSFKERNLQDTKTASRFMLNMIRDRLQFAPSVRDRKKRVTAVNGAVTAYMRKRFGLTKLRENGDLHHAIDALVVACTTDGMIREISRYSSLRECEYTHTDDANVAVNRYGEVLRHFPAPWPYFRKELEARLSNDPARVLNALPLPFYLQDEVMDRVRPLFVSRMPHRKISGPAHKDTVRRALSTTNGDYVVTKKPLTSLKLDKNGEIEGYFNPSSDRLLYEALRARLTLFGGNAAKAFSEPFYKPKKDGSNGPRVDKVKIMEKSGMSVPVHNGQGVAEHDTMVRIDVFHVEHDGYYLVPIYVADTITATLPQKACVPSKPYAAWKAMDDRDFVFSLYPNDLIRLTNKRGIKLNLANSGSSLPPTQTAESVFLYYRGADRSTASISGVVHDGAYQTRGLGIKTLTKIEKYTVDVLGHVHPVKQEKRQNFAHKKKG